ncbi:MAG: fatty acid desaturase, partial [Thermoanaerobaculia bacterium]
IIQHDCGHGSFFPSKRANNVLGSILGVVTLTPYRYWRRTHAIHHATSGNLDRREFGEVSTLTVGEYQAASRWKRLGYRVYRNPITLLVLGPAWQFLIKHRLPVDAPKTWRAEWLGVMGTNVALAGAVAVMVAVFGLAPFLMVWAPIFVLSGAAGIWLFYVQHQFEDTYWERQPEWDFHLASLQGSSFYDLPAVGHWFTGNIGYHHIHHLSSRIPNYNLPRCMEEVPDLRHVTRFGFLESLGCLPLTLWDEERGKLVRFRDLRGQAAQEAPAT